jgi:antitoxin Phd
VRVWRLRDAKARLSALIQAACEQGPQDISVRGRTVVVMVSKELFDRLTAQRPPTAGDAG